MHNKWLVESPKANLLNLPSDVQANIFQKVLINDERILVSAESPEECREPGLLAVCHGIRQEARLIFYKANEFEICIQSYDVKAVMPWLDKAEAFVDSKRTLKACPVQDATSGVRKGIQKRIEDATANYVADMEKLGKLTHWQSRAIEFPYHYQSIRNMEMTTGSQYWNVLYEPQWKNLVVWLKKYHAGEVGECGWADIDPHDARQIVVLRVFEIVTSLKDESWAIVAKVLPGLRGMLRVDDAGWMTTGGVEDNEDDVDSEEDHYEDGEEGEVEDAMEVEEGLDDGGSAVAEGGAEVDGAISDDEY